jgi:hypothetical protein
VTANTVLRWQRRRFREHWTRLSGRPTDGRPPVRSEIKTLIGRMAAANRLCGAPRIHGELLKLDIDVAERTVSRLLSKRRSPPSQTWRTFLTNHVRDLVSVDFFTVPTARLRVLFVFVVLAHDRRRILTSMSPSIPPRPGRPSRSWTRSRTTPPRPTSFVTATRSTVTCSGSAYRELSEPELRQFLGLEEGRRPALPVDPAPGNFGLDRARSTR